MERRINIEEILPADAFLATKYFDYHRNFITRRVYFNTGLVQAFDGNEWWTVCQLSSEQIKAAKNAISNSGLMRAKDVADKNIYDTAILTFAWRLNDKEDLVSNYAYPAVDHPAFDKLEEALDKLERNCSQPME